MVEKSNAVSSARPSSKSQSSSRSPSTPPANRSSRNQSSTKGQSSKQVVKNSRSKAASHAKKMGNTPSFRNQTQFKQASHLSSNKKTSDIQKKGEVKASTQSLAQKNINAFNKPTNTANTPLKANEKSQSGKESHQPLSGGEKKAAELQESQDKQPVSGDLYGPRAEGLRQEFILGQPASPYGEQIEYKLHNDAKSLIQRIVNGEITENEGKAIYNAKFKALDQQLPPSSPSSPPKHLNQKYLDQQSTDKGPVQLTADSRDTPGARYEPVQLQIAEEALLRLNWEQTDYAHTAGYGPAFNARKSLLGYGLASQGITSAGDLEKNWYNDNDYLNKLAKDAQQSLLNKSTGFNNDGSSKGSSALVDAADYFLQHNVDYGSNTLAVPNLENKPVSEYTDRDKVRALSHFSQQPLSLEANQPTNNQRFLKFAEEMMNAAMILDGVGMVSGFVEGIESRALTEKLTDKVLQEEAGNQILPDVAGKELETANQLASQNLENQGYFKEGTARYETEVNGKKIYLKQEKGRLFREVDFDGNGGWKGNLYARDIDGSFSKIGLKGGAPLDKFFKKERYDATQKINKAIENFHASENATNERVGELREKTNTLLNNSNAEGFRTVTEYREGGNGFYQEINSKLRNNISDGETIQFLEEFNQLNTAEKQTAYRVAKAPKGLYGSNIKEGAIVADKAPQSASIAPEFAYDWAKGWASDVGEGEESIIYAYDDSIQMKNLATGKDPSYVAVSPDQPLQVIKIKNKVINGRSYKFVYLSEYAKPTAIDNIKNIYNGGDFYAIE